jgi:hypothetical protein
MIYGLRQLVEPYEYPSQKLFLQAAMLYMVHACMIGLVAVVIQRKG